MAATIIVTMSNLHIYGPVPVNAVVVKHKSLDRFLQTVDVDKRKHKDGVGAIGELEDSLVVERVLLR